MLIARFDQNRGGRGAAGAVQVERRGGGRKSQEPCGRSPDRVTGRRAIGSKGRSGERCASAILGIANNANTLPISGGGIVGSRAVNEL